MPEDVETREAYTFMPLIVTNSPLYYLEYEEKHIDEKGDLKNYSSLKEVPYLAFNFSEYLGFNTDNGYQTDEVEKQVKSVFIVNIKHLKDFLDRREQIVYGDIDLLGVRKF